MKKAVKSATTPLLPAVVERVDDTRARGKTVRLPASADMPPVEVLKLNGTREAGDRTLQYSMMQADRARAWMKLFVTLNDLVIDPLVSTNPATVEFVQVMRELARSATLADSAEEALQPIDTLLPAGRHGQKFKDGRKPGSVGPVRAFVRRYMKKSPKAKTAEVWAAIKARPPVGVTVHDPFELRNRRITTIGAQPTGYRQFTNIVSEEGRNARDFQQLASP